MMASLQGFHSSSGLELRRSAGASKLGNLGDIAAVYILHKLATMKEFDQAGAVATEVGELTIDAVALVAVPVQLVLFE